MGGDDLRGCAAKEQGNHFPSNLKLGGLLLREPTVVTKLPLQ